MLQGLGSDYFSILLTVPLSPLFRPNKRSSFFGFQKACWDDFTFNFEFYYHSAEEYSSLSFSSAAAFFTSVALNVAKSSIPFGYFKCQNKVWWFPGAEEAISEKRKPLPPLMQVIMIDRLTSVPLDTPRLLSPKPRLRHCRQHACFSLLKLILN